MAISLAAVHMAACIFAIVSYMRDYTGYAENVQNFYNINAGIEKGLIWVAWTMAVVDFGCLVFVLQLLIFHFYLMCTK